MRSVLRLSYLMLFSCNNGSNIIQKTVSGDVRCINVTYNMPIADQKTGNVLNFQDSCQIFFKGSLLMYKIPYSSEFVFKDSTRTEIRNQFFIYEKNQDSGFNYDEYRPYDTKKMPVDSVIKQKAFSQLNMFYQFFEKKELILFSSLRDPSNLYLEEKYIPREKKDFSDFDTAFFYFSNQLNGLDFSLMKSLDSVKQLKLFRVSFLTIPTYYPEYRITVQKRDLYFDVKEIPVTNQKEILGYFERYNRDFYKDTPRS